jgi:hypothetical protein
MTPEEMERTEQATANAQWSDDISGAQEKERKWERQRELDGHDRLMAGAAASASRDALHNGAAGKNPGDYTVYEARDRAAHTPSVGAPEPER